ncbi:MAG: 3-hydroxybutyryl-CoA dehydrogenase [Candidatus Azotimanducaceae bacterium]|jgi:3-hydroxybutyryl-CoA dehydrogenase
MLNKTAVVGAGLMGTGIAKHLANAGSNVTLIDTNDAQLNSAKQHLEGLSLSLSTSLDVITDCDFVIEAVFEDLEVKRNVLSQISDVVDQNCIVASNTSSLLVEDLAVALTKTERFIGVHYNNPADFNPIVEIVPCAGTKESLAPQLANWFNNHEKTAVICADTPCFVLNRQSLPYINEAARCLELAAPGDIDAIALDRLGVGLGPFAVMNLVGLPVMAAASRNLAVLGNGYLAAPALQAQTEPWVIGAPTPLAQETISEITQRLRGAMIFPGQDILNNQLCTAEDLTKICKLALGYEKSSPEWLEIYEPTVTRQLIERYLSNQ